MKNKLIIISGIPRSGKSTIANQWVKFGLDIQNNQVIQPSIEAQGNPNPRVIVCADDIRLALTNQRWCAPAEPFVHAIKTIMIKALLLRGFDVIIDGTHSLLSHIKELLYIDPDADYLIINTPKEVCIERAIKTKQDDLIPVIERMDQQLSEWINDAENQINLLRDKVKK